MIQVNEALRRNLSADECLALGVPLGEEQVRILAGSAYAEGRLAAAKDVEEQCSLSYLEGYDEGRADGYESGREAGYQAGYDAAIAELEGRRRE